LVHPTAEATTIATPIPNIAAAIRLIFTILASAFAFVSTGSVLPPREPL
jgi:hypothetical protein